MKKIKEKKRIKPFDGVSSQKRFNLHSKHSKKITLEKLNSFFVDPHFVDDLL